LVTGGPAGLSLMFGKGDGSFEAPSVSFIDPSTNLTDLLSVAVGDFNDDGTMDLVVTSAEYYSFYYETIEATVLLSNGDRTFSAQTSAYVEFENRARTTVVTDFDGDGDLDLLVNIAGYYVRVLVGDGEGHLVLAGDQNWDIGDYSGSVVSMAVGDLDHDGVLDLVAQDRAHVRVRLGNGQGGFEAPPGGLIYTAGDKPMSVALGDFDRDGNLDVATANRDSNDVSFLRGNGYGAFAPPEQSAAGAGPCSIAAGDFNGDGWLDVATANATGNNVSVLFNNQSWGAPPPTITISDVTVTEGNTGTVSATFTLILSRAAGVDVTVHYDTAGITAAAGPPQADYTAAAGDVVIPAGTTSQTFTIAVIGDRLAEPTETFSVNLSAPTNASIADRQGIGTILDNEPRVHISDFTKSEGKNGKTFFTFTVTLSASYDQPVTMSYRTVDGTAKTSDSDYIAKTGTLTFTPGQTTKTITIQVKGDSKQEANETFYLDLFGLSGNSLFTKSRGIGSILNDD